MTIVGFNEDIEKNAFIWNKNFDVEQSILILKNQLNNVKKKIESINRLSVVGSSIPASLTMVFKPVGSLRFPVGYAESVGRRPSMEDQVVIMGMGPRLRENEDYFAIFDGHGGSFVAEECSKSLHKRLRNALYTINDVKEAITFAFTKLDEEFCAERTCGSTGLMAYITQSILYVANIGDSRAVLGLTGEKALRLSVDHKPCLQSERDRICRIGGSVQQIGGAWRVNGVLAVSRAFGDFALKPFVTAVPYISETLLTPDHLFLVMACDGLWDVLSDEQVVSIVHQQSNPHEAAELLRRTAFTRGSDDNISVVVIFLKDRRLWVV